MTRHRRGRARRPRLRHPDRRRPDRRAPARRSQRACRASAPPSSPTRTSPPRISRALIASLDAGRHRQRRRSRLPAGEKTKSFDALQQVVDGVLAARLERGDAVIALGGGVIGDLAGFAAGIVRRGMNFVQMPTSLLAQVDSSVGGKTGINSAHGKNLVGVFHQPQLVLADTDALDTLPRARIPRRLCRSRQIRADRPAGLLRLAGEELAGGVCRRPGAHRGDRRILPRQGRCRGPRRVRDRRPRAAQSRPHLRPRAGGGDRL